MEYSYDWLCCRDEQASRLLRSQQNDALDAKYGYERYKLPSTRLGWLINMHPVSVWGGGLFCCMCVSCVCVCVCGGQSGRMLSSILG